MNRKSSVLVWIAGSLLVVPSLWAQPDGSDLTIEVTTDQTYYALGDPVRVTVTKCNPTSQAISVPHDCLCCHDQIYALDAEGEAVSEGIFGCILILYSLHLEPGECSSEDFVWNQLSPAFDVGDPVAAGTYSLFHTWTFPGFTMETESEPIILGTVPAIPTLGRLEAAGLALFLAFLSAAHLIRRRLSEESSEGGPARRGESEILTE